MVGTVGIGRRAAPASLVERGAGLDEPAAAGLAAGLVEVEPAGEEAGLGCHDSIIPAGGDSYSGQPVTMGAVGRRNGVRRPLLLAVAVALSLAGCGDDDSPTAAGTTSTSEETTSSTSSAVPDDGGEPVRCEELPAPSGTVRDGPVTADVDGDGVDDEVRIVEQGEAALAVDVAHGAGGRTVLVLDDASVFTVADVRVDRVADLDDDGDDDLWVVVGSGASVEVVALVLADGCDLVRPDASGQPNQFAVGASVGFTNGVECVEGGFLEHEGENVGGSTYRGTTTEWLVAGTALEEGDATPFEIDAESGGFAAYAGLTCER